MILKSKRGGRRPKAVNVKVSFRRNPDAPRSPIPGALENRARVDDALIAQELRRSLKDPWD